MCNCKCCNFYVKEEHLGPFMAWVPAWTNPGFDTPTSPAAYNANASRNRERWATVASQEWPRSKCCPQRTGTMDSHSANQFLGNVGNPVVPVRSFALYQSAGFFTNWGIAFFVTPGSVGITKNGIAANRDLVFSAGTGSPSTPSSWTLWMYVSEGGSSLTLPSGRQREFAAVIKTWEFDCPLHWPKIFKETVTGIDANNCLGVGQSSLYPAFFTLWSSFSLDVEISQWDDREVARYGCPE